MTTPTIAKELIAALDAMPVKRLIRYVFRDDRGECCALGAMQYNTACVPKNANQYVKISLKNDKFQGTPEQRWQHMRDWAQGIVDSE